MKRNDKIKGFTLAEVMLAIGIMGIGMVFAACLFPAAIKEGEGASNAVEGTAISNNVIATAKLRLTQDLLFNMATDPYTCRLSPATDYQISRSGNLVYMIIDKNTNHPDCTTQKLLGNDLVYPLNKENVGENDEKPPFIESILLLQRRSPNDNRNDYMIIAVSCRKKNKDTTLHVAAIDLDNNYDKGSDTIELDNENDNRYLFVNGTILYTSVQHSTVFANVAGIDGNKITLNHILQADETTNGNTSNYIVVIYEQEGTGSSAIYTNPVMSMTAIRAPLGE